jgi:hypothetical protein
MVHNLNQLKKHELVGVIQTPGQSFFETVKVYVSNVEISSQNDYPYLCYLKNMRSLIQKKHALPYCLLLAIIPTENNCFKLEKIFVKGRCRSGVNLDRKFFALYITQRRYHKNFISYNKKSNSKK